MNENFQAREPRTSRVSTNQIPIDRRLIIHNIAMRCFIFSSNFCYARVTDVDWIWRSKFSSALHQLFPHLFIKIQSYAYDYKSRAYRSRELCMGPGCLITRHLLQLRVGRARALERGFRRVVVNSTLTSIYLPYLILPALVTRACRSPATSAYSSHRPLPPRLSFASPRWVPRID